MVEYLDILDSEGDSTGKSREFGKVHEEGLLHRSVHVWFINSKGEVLLQKRSKNMRPYPSSWDASAAGHVSSGQTSVEAAMREVEEELGIVLQKGDLEYLCTLRQMLPLEEGGTDNEFQDVYVAHKDVSIEDIHLQESEVEDVIWMPISEIDTWAKENGEKLTPHEEEREKVQAYIEENKTNIK